MPQTVLYVGVGLAVLIGLWVVVTNNSFIKSRNKVDEAWSGIDVQLKRRHDLVPNLVETVKGYAAHESATLAAVVQARSAAMSAGSSTERAAADRTCSAPRCRASASSPSSTPSCAPRDRARDHDAAAPHR